MYFKCKNCFFTSYVFIEAEKCAWGNHTCRSAANCVNNSTCICYEGMPGGAINCSGEYFKKF